MENRMFHPDTPSAFLVPFHFGFIMGAGGIEFKKRAQSSRLQKPPFARLAEGGSSRQYDGHVCPSAVSLALMVSKDTTVTNSVMAHAIPEEKSLIQKA